MANQKKIRPIMAVIGAVSVSGLLTSELMALLFGLSYTLPDGAIQKAAFVVSGIVSLAFFIWFGLHAYTVEIDLMTGKYDLPDE